MAAMARPLKTPRANCWLLMDLSTGWPRPATPIIEAMTTIDRAIMIVWLTPAMMLGRARGICAPSRRWRGLAPKALAASITSLSTSRMPRSVRRMTGGMA